MTDSDLPEGRSSLAYPSSIEIPRDRSSASRSVFTPVSAPTNAVFPWSMCPAVPSVSGAQVGAAGVSPIGWHAESRADLGARPLGFLVRQRARVEQQAPLGDPADYGWIARPQCRRQPV